jgi:predicted metal-binding protein
MIEEITKELILKENVRVVIDLKNSRAWCGRPYVGHPKGCPNFGKDRDCPPEVGLFTKIYKPMVRLAIVRFDFEAYLKRRREKFPDITEKSLRNPLYWQGHVRAVARKWAKEIVKAGEEIIEKPEAMGVDVNETCKRLGIILEWPPKKNVYRVTVLARRK